MALTLSNPFEKGALAPNFNLLDVVSNKQITLQDIKGEVGTVVMFICNHCPYVIHVNEQLVSLANEYLEKGIGFVAISSNDTEKYPQDAPDKMKDVALDLQYPFPYLFDETQEVAKAYDATCTPDFYVFDKDLKSIYHGQLDESRPGNDKPNTGENIRKVLESLVINKEYLGDEKPSMGCGIKWK